MSKRLTDYKVLTFDCYGTLIDWETGIWDALQPLIMSNRCSDITRQVALNSFAWHESALETEMPELLYRTILEKVHVVFAAEFDLESTPRLDVDFGSSVAHWPAFPDTAISRHSRRTAIPQDPLQTRYSVEHRSRKFRCFQSQTGS